MTDCVKIVMLPPARSDDDDDSDGGALPKRRGSGGMDRRVEDDGGALQEGSRKWRILQCVYFTSSYSRRRPVEYTRSGHQLHKGRENKP
eukprot:1184044-Prorocentrum_minimum.AAC.3